MAETRYHVYYRVVGPEHVRVLAIWSAVRGRGPRLCCLPRSLTGCPSRSVPRLK